MGIIGTSHRDSDYSDQLLRTILPKAHRAAPRMMSHFLDSADPSDLAMDETWANLATAID
jgi:hypothetical protein